MKAVLLESFGNVTVSEVDEPRIVNSDDVIVRLAAAGVCRTDLETIDGGLQGAYGVPDFPYVAGHENAGWVEAVGSEVDSLAVGDPVLLHPFVSCGRCSGCRAGRDMYCARSRFPGVDATSWGGFAEYMRTGVRSVVPLSADANLVALSPYTDAGITAYHAVKRLQPFLLPGTKVAVLGVGGVGHFGLQLLKHMSPCEVVAVEAAPSRAKLAEDLGANHVFSGGVLENVAAVREITDGGADVVIDFIGSADSPEASLGMLVDRGGVFSAVGAGGTMTIETLDLAMRELTVLGNLVGTYTELEELVLLNAGLRSEHVVYPLDEAAQALEDLRNGRLDGRAVLVPQN